MTLILVISGGQTGVDSAGLMAAQRAGLKTGGWIPKGYRRQAGRLSGRAVAAKFGLQEHKSWAYKHRTWDNVKWADGTVKIAANFNSPGTICTCRAITEYEKPYVAIHAYQQNQKDKLIQFILQNNIGVLNVAGNAEATSPGIYTWTYNFLLEVFGELNEN